MAILRVLGRFSLFASLLLSTQVLSAPAALANAVPLKDLGRLGGWRDNALVGYGLVSGLAGSGDSSRSGVTRQALRNVLNRLGTSVTDDQINSRNVAVVIVTATLPASANVGDRIDVTVSSIGDARSLAGGTLLMTPLQGPDRSVYALAQGGVVTGGYRFDANFNSQQRNYPTSATLPNGATVERAVNAELLNDKNGLTFLLRDPSFTTAQRVADGVNQRFGFGTAAVISADEIAIAINGVSQRINRTTREPIANSYFVIASQVSYNPRIGANRERLIKGYENDFIVANRSNLCLDRSAAIRAVITFNEANITNCAKRSISLDMG